MTDSILVATRKGLFDVGLDGRPRSLGFLGDPVCALVIAVYESESWKG